MKNKIQTAVITCGGYATRRLPITKAIPKEMLPIGNFPAIHFILEELENAGIKNVLILLGRGREALMNYLDVNFELDEHLRAKNKRTPTNFFKDLNIFYRRVPMPRGAADCVSFAREFVGRRKFILAFCDDIYFDANPTAELIADFNENGKQAITATEILGEKIKNYGVIKWRAENEIEVINEKPKKAESQFIAGGRYLLGDKVFARIEAYRKLCESWNREICLTDILNDIAEEEGLRGVQTAATRIDVGS
ncbi:MAG: hypothetical protein LBM01_00250 [Christensenellaceae bacterium]|jgi:UTP--glucose-1-phosphate uridylyltransferase|nr:hypothetical protein [Christensenellaceae bacterium]